MKFSLPTLLGFLLLLSFVSAAQDPITIGLEVPANLHTTKDEFIKSESDIITSLKKVPKDYVKKMEL